MNDPCNALAGYEFVATLQLRTPRAVLMHDGELHVGSLASAPKYGTPADGVWVPKAKSWDELRGYSLPNATGPTEAELDRRSQERLRSFGFTDEQIRKSPRDGRASDLGPVAPASGYLQFLIAFRTVVESKASIDERLERLSILEDQTPQYGIFFASHRERDACFPRSFFVRELAVLLSIGVVRAEMLFNAGYRTLDDIRRAEEEQLLALPGIGRKTVRELKRRVSS